MNKREFDLLNHRKNVILGQVKKCYGMVGDTEKSEELRQILNDCANDLAEFGIEMRSYLID